MNLCRSRLRERQHEEASNRAELGPGTRTAGTTPTEDALVVLAAVRTLPQRQREAVVLRYYADLAEQDVAKVLGCSVGTVKSQLARARVTLARPVGRAISQ